MNPINTQTLVAPIPSKAQSNQSVKPAVTETVATTANRLSVKDHIKLGAQLYGKENMISSALIGGLGGAVATPLLVGAMTNFKGSSTLALVSLIGGAVGGTALGAGSGYIKGAAVGAVNGALVNLAGSKTQAQIGAAILGAGASVAVSALFGKLGVETIVNATVAAGVLGFTGGIMYEDAEALAK